jgi:protochlorophyllide reductase
MSRDKWTIEDMPDQTGRVAVVTGANTGLGLETARALADRPDVLLVGGPSQPTALVVPRGQLKTNLLGMSFLNRLHSFEIREGRLEMRAKAQ